MKEDSMTGWELVQMSKRGGSGLVKGSILRLIGGFLGRPRRCRRDIICRWVAWSLLDVVYFGSDSSTAQHYMR